jgi:hypothetical protein
MKLYEVIIDRGEHGTQGIISFKDKQTAEQVAEAFNDLIEGKLVVAKEVGENES